MLPVIMKGRQTGKTKECIERCAEMGGYIVCHSYFEARRIHQTAQMMGFDIPFPLTFEEITYGEKLKGIKPLTLHIDNGDVLFEY